MFAEVQRKLIKEQWKDGFPINATLHLCTDGSKTEQGTEAEIFGQELKSV